MKNNKIVDSWNKIEPDSTADERMLNAILARNQSSLSDKKKVHIMSKSINRKWFAPIAACFVMVVALTAIIGNNANWFGPTTFSTDLRSGETLTFYRSDVPNTASIDFGTDVISRDLTSDENAILFGDSSAVAFYGTFNATDNSLIHLEGRIDEAKVIFAAPGTPLTDVVIEGVEATSDVNGIPVTAGYFITHANSQGIKNAIYFASFTLGDISVYVEVGGTESESEILRSAIGSIIERLIENGAPDLSMITM